MKKITNLMIHSLKINKNCNKKMDDKSKKLTGDQVYVKNVVMQL